MDTQLKRPKKGGRTSRSLGRLVRWLVCNGHRDLAESFMEVDDIATAYNLPDDKLTDGAKDLRNMIRDVSHEWSSPNK